MLIEAMLCPEQDKVQLATFSFEGKAGYQWKGQEGADFGVSPNLLELFLMNPSEKYYSLWEYGIVESQAG